MSYGFDRRGVTRVVARTALFLLVGTVAMWWLLHPSVTDAASDGNNPPTNVACQGWQRDTVIVSWADNDNDEVNYRVERSIDGAAFTEVATISPNSGGGYDAYRDTGIDVNKNYRYRVRGAHGDGTFTDYGPICNNRRIFETSNVANNGFRIFYGLEGTTDNCPAIDGNDVCLANTNPLTIQQNALEGSADAFTRLGFDRDAAVPNGGLDKIPVNVVWCDGGGCAGGESLGLSPFLLETAFDLTTRVGDPIAYLVSEHEVFHFQQFKYGGLNDPAGQWVIEGQARSSQDKVCIGANRATALCFDDINTGYAGYVGELNGYLANTATPVNQSSYAAALFWTYVVEKFGTSAVGDAVEGGMNLMSEFWKQSAANPNRDGIAILNSTLQALGTSMRFRDVWKDFAVANYAKNLTGTGVQTKYQYADMAQPGGNYDPVTFRVNQALTLNTPFLRTGETVYPWAAHYYRFTPAANIPVIDIRVTQDTSVPLYYTVFGVRNQDVVFEYNVEARNLNQTILNNAFTEVVVVVAGLENLANYRVAINSTQPTLRILTPTTANQARVGDFTAPEKFRVTVQILAADGTPLSGVDLNNFNFRVGTKDLTNDLVIARSSIQDQQWFVLRAPTQDATGTYDLHVNYANNASLSTTNTLAVNYAPRINADNMLIIDRSGSMAGNKLDAAKKAARLYVDSWRTGDKLGVIGYDHVAAINMEMKDWTDTGTNTRQEALNAINGLTPGGATAIGDALTLGFNEVTAKGDPTHDWALILLSDGLEEGPITVDFATAINNIAGAAGKRPVIHAIAIGPNADGPRMQNAATATGGTYQFVSEPVAVSAAGVDGTEEVALAYGLHTMEGVNNPDAPQLISNPRLDLNLRYRYIAADVLGHQQNYNTVGPANDGDFDEDIRLIPVEGSAAEISISLSFASFCVSCRFELKDPNGTVYNSYTYDPNGLHYVWRIPTPVPGNWTMRIYYYFQGPKAASVDSPDQGELLSPYLIQTAIKSDLLFDVALPVPVAQRVTGMPMPIVATLTDLGPVTGAGVWAYVTNPYGASTYMTLWDDGLHGDGAANDGVYANTYYQTGFGGTSSGSGSYTAEVFASGNTTAAGNFLRQKLLGFYMYGGDSDGNGDGFPDGDADSDGLPDEYERLHTGSPTALDPAADDDGDGRTNSDEWQAGTDPFNPDTDGGGGSDGSEYNNGTNPLDPSDDNIEPTWTVAYPGDSKVFVRYAPRADYALVEIHRSSEGFTGTYLFLDQVNNTSGLYTDTTVMNDQEYCYYVIGIKATGEQSARTTPSCATPKADPWAPEGGFLINGGASRTESVNVTLNIFASDSVSPHAHSNELDEIMEPLGSSSTSVTHMRISNNGDMSGSSFVPYAQSAPWTLDETNGLATVYMQFRDEAGNVSRIVTNSIVVEQTGPVFNDTLVMPFLRRQ